MAPILRALDRSWVSPGHAVPLDRSSKKEPIVLRVDAVVYLQLIASTANRSLAQGAHLAARARMTVGEELAEARRKLGLSLEDVAAETNVPVERLRAIEAADYGWQSPAAAEAAIRAYASVVQLEGEDVTPAAVAQLPIVPTVEQQSLATYVSEGLEPPQAVRPRMLMFEWEAGEAAPLRSNRGYATLDSEPAYESDDSNEHRFSDARVPVAALVFVSALAVTGGFLLSASRDADLRETLAAMERERATQPAPQGDAQAAQPQEPSATAAEVPAPSSPPTTPAAEPTPADRVPDRPPEMVEAVSRSTPPSSIAEGPRPAPKDAKPADLPSTKRDAVRTPEPTPPSAFVAVPESSRPSAPESPGTPVSAGEISGAWNVVAQQAEAPAAHAPPSYRLQLEQRGTRIVGSAYQTSEDGRRSRPSDIAGTFSGGRLTLDLSGGDRARFVLYRGGGDSFVGRVRRTGGGAGATIVKLERPVVAGAR